MFSKFSIVDFFESATGWTDAKNEKGKNWWPIRFPTSTRSCGGAFPSFLLTRMPSRLQDGARGVKKFRSTIDDIRDEKHNRELSLAVTMLIANVKLAAAAGFHPGLLLAASPPIAPKPVVELYQPMKEEEYFLELIFPGYFRGAFMWDVTLAQFAMFAASMFVGHDKGNPSPCSLYLLGASWGPAVASGQLWRLVCPMLLHANMMHLFFNVFFQLRIGFGMEKQFGRKKMQILYLVCGIIGNLVSIAIDPYKLAVGASTAGFGLIGVWFAEILLSWELLGPHRDRTLVWIIFMMVSVTSISSITPNMDLYGHLGGALGGFLTALIMADMKEEHKPEWYDASKRAAVVGLTALLLGCGGKILLHTPHAPLPDCSWLKVFGQIK